MAEFPPIRLAALDLDGTLLSNHNDIGPRTVRAIEEAVAHGVTVLPATGRPLASLPPVVAQLPGVRYAITSNGAAVWDLGTDPVAAVYSRYGELRGRKAAEPLWVQRSLFPVEKAREVFALLMEYDGDMSIFSDGHAVKDQRSLDFTLARMARHAKSTTEARQPNDGRFTVVRDLTEWMSRHAHEIEKMCLFFNDPSQLPEALGRFEAIEGIEVVQGAPDNVEVTAAGVDKGEALLALADRLGIPHEQTLAVGDSENDRAMLQKAGVAAVMANGMEHIKAIADIVSEADCDHDGVAELFERLGVGTR